MHDTETEQIIEGEGRRAAAGKLPWLVVLIALLLAGLLRDAHLRQLEREAVIFGEPVGEAREVHLWARDLARGTFEYQVPIHGPLHPWLLSLAYRAFDEDALSIRRAQLALGLASILLLFLAGRAFAGAWPAACGAALLALYRPALLFDAELYGEGLAVFLTLLAAGCALWAVRRPGWLSAIAAGAVLGLCALTRSNLLLLLPATGLLLLFLAPASRRRRLASLALMTAACFAPILPVTFLNHRASGAWILLRQRGGHDLYMANRPGSDGTPDPRFGPRYDAFNTRPHVEADAWGPKAESAFYAGLFWKRAREHPGELLGLLFRKAWISLSPVEVPSSYWPEGQALYSRIARLPLPGFGWLLPLILVGLFLAPLRRDARLVLLGFLAAVWVSLVFGFAAGRCRYQIAGLTALAAGAGLHALVVRSRRGGAASLAAWGTLVAGLALALLAPRLAEHRAGWKADFLALVGTAHTRRASELEGSECLRELEEARRSFEESIALDDAKPYPHFMLGYMLQTWGQGKRRAQAYAYYRAAIHRFPSYLHAFRNRALLQYAGGLDELAARDMERVVELEPFRAGDWRALAEIYTKLERVDAARECTARAEAEEARLERLGPAAFRAWLQ